MRATFVRGLSDKEQSLLTRGRITEVPSWTIREAVAYLTRCLGTTPISEVEVETNEESVRSVKMLAPALGNACWECGSTDHRKGSCPQLKDRMKKMGPPSDDCHMCGTAGCRRWKCPLKKKAFNKELECDLCGKGGHVTRACWKKRRKEAAEKKKDFQEGN